MPYNHTAIEKKWQQYWTEHHSFRALDPKEAGNMPRIYILDMFPYPSGDGLHVGHAEQQAATDILSRFKRMQGFNVLHPMGWDAFGLPAEQYAIRNGIHPRITTKKNIDTFRRQMQLLGLSYDWEREVNTTDPNYYRWTQWIFLQLFNSYFDPIEEEARPIAHLLNELQNENLVVAPDGSIHVNPAYEGMEALTGEVRVERLWRELDEAEQRDVIDSQRLAYQDEIPVNWCPGLGTVLANEEVIDGKSEVGGFPVVKQPMRQWMLRITAYADRLLADLDALEWPESLKEMQRNWIGKSTGAEIDFDVDPTGIAPIDPSAKSSGPLDNPGLDAQDEDADASLVITVFTTRPDTLYGATYMVLAPEHPLVSRLMSWSQSDAVEKYRAACAGKSDRDRIENKEKTGVFTGAYAINPISEQRIPIWIADYVLTGYGTGAIMAVPAHDERDYEFAVKFSLPIVTVVRPKSGAGPVGTAFVDEGIAVNSPVIEGQPTAEAKEQMTEIAEAEGWGHRSVKYKLRDWLFSRQRYWGEPFPIILDASGNAHAVAEEDLPVMLPEVEDFKPTGTPEPPLSKARDWVRTTWEGKPAVRETNTMPQWAGSCWYYLRYLDPHNSQCFVDKEKEKYWMPVDLYVGGVEHAVLHLLYARFWHKVLFDLGHVSSAEPFKRLVNQGFILGETEYHAFETTDGKIISAADVRDIQEEATETSVNMIAFDKKSGDKLIGKRTDEVDVEKAGEGFRLRSNPSIRVDARSFKMSKSRGNVVNPDAIIADYGADVFRLYEMYMGPLETQKPWNTRDIVGMSRFLSGVHRNLVGDEEAGKRATISADVSIPETIDRQMHRTMKKVAEDIESLRFNTAIAELIKLNNEMGKLPAISKSLAEIFTLMLAPFAPHLAEEIWQSLGHDQSLAREPWPKFDPAKLIESMLELPVQVNGKLRGKVSVAADAGEQTVIDAAKTVETVKPWIDGKTIAKQVYVDKKLVNFVVK